MTGLNPRVVLCGCHEYGRHLFKRLVAAGVPIAYVVALTPEQGKEHRVSGYEDLRPLAIRHGIPVYVPEYYALNGPADHAFFEQQRFDILIQGGWQRLFPEHLLNSLTIGAVGVHGSPDFLPKGRGRSPLNWSIIHGESRFMLQLFLMRPGVDDGPVFDWEDFDITPFDTIGTLYYKNVILTARMITRSLSGLLAGTLPLRSQQGQPSHYGKRGPEDGWIDWETMRVVEIHNLVRAVTHPYPGAFARLEGEDCVIWRAQIFDTRITYPDWPYGAVVEHFDDCLVVNCRGGLLLIEDYEALPKPQIVR